MWSKEPNSIKQYFLIHSLGQKFLALEGYFLFSEQPAYGSRADESSPQYTLSILILSSPLHYGLSCNFCPSSSPNKILCANSLIPQVCHKSLPFNSSNISWRIQIINLLIIQRAPLHLYLLSLRSIYSPRHSLIE